MYYLFYLDSYYALLTSFNYYNSYMHHMVKETSMCHTELYNHTSFHSLFNF